MKKDIMIVATMLFTFALGWYYVYVKPADEFRYAVLDCMQEIDDYSKDAYTFCSKNVQRMKAFKNEPR